MLNVKKITLVLWEQIQNQMEGRIKTVNRKMWEQQDFPTHDQIHIIIPKINFGSVK